jgi:hypothetical protein
MRVDNPLLNPRFDLPYGAVYGPSPTFPTAKTPCPENIKARLLLDGRTDDPDEVEHNAHRIRRHRRHVRRHCRRRILKSVTIDQSLNVSWNVVSNIDPIFGERHYTAQYRQYTSEGRVHVWIGTGAIILKGVNHRRRRDRCAGTVLARDVAPGARATGNPAQVTENMP